jgi:hypothetical protein
MLRTVFSYVRPDTVVFTYVALQLTYSPFLSYYSGPEEPSRYRESLRDGRSRERILVRESFCSLADQPWVPSSLLYNWYQVMPEVKRQGRGFNPLPTSRAEVKEKYTCSYTPCRCLHGRLLGEIFFTSSYVHFRES